MVWLIEKRLLRTGSKTQYYSNCYFLNASNTLDRIKYWKLFHKLTVRNVPKYIIRLLINWYQNQKVYIRWGASTSCVYRASNCVKQGGILSPRLFNIYMDDLTNELISRIGDNVGGHLINHLCYADNLTKHLAYVHQVWKKLLAICNRYGIEHKLAYNTLKSNAKCFKLKEMNLKRYPVFEFY